MNMLFAPPPVPIELRGYQADVLEKLREAIRSGQRRVVLVAPTAAGKCLGKGTPVLMFDGSVRNVEEVKVGDLLMGPDSKPRRVLSLATGVGPLYRVTPKKGMPYVVNDAHILSLKMTAGATKWNCSRSDQFKKGRIHNISVTDYLAKSRTFRHCAKGWRTAVEFAEEKSLPLPPYFFGLWIGDGISRATAICSADPEIIAEVERVANSFGLETNYERPDGNASVVVHATGRVRGKDNPIRTALKQLGVFGNKHIPRLYLTACRKDRMELLAGLLDTDGSLSRGGYDFVQKSQRIADEVAFLARSLGLAAYVYPCRKTCGNTGAEGDYWRVSISGDCSDIPVRLARRKAPPRLMKKDVLLVGLTVEDIGDGEYFGFQIDGDRLFLLGDFTVTHNTEMAMDLIKKAQAKGSRCWFIVDRVSLIDQTSERFMKHGIDHGVIQANHWLTDYAKPVQIASAQTLARRRVEDDLLPDLIIQDEAHCRYKSVADLISRLERSKAVGLTATPFTAGMADDWDGLVNSVTVNQLLAQGYLTPLKIKACVAPDMKGAKKKFNGEYEEEEAGSRGITIIGDVVNTWIEQTRKHFGGPVKTIVFSPSVKHGAELCKQFQDAGFNFQQISYLDADDDARRVKISEFRKDDSSIDGLVSCAVLTKGFDVPDVRCGISCRPYRKSFSSHIQEMGRVMRIAPGKDFGLWLDHSGNAIAFADDTSWLFENGVDSLSNASRKDSEIREPQEKTRKERFCAECGMQMQGITCSACGWTRPERGEIQIVHGELVDVDLSACEAFKPRPGLRAECLKDPKAIWNAALSYTTATSSKGPEHARKWAAGIWKGIYERWPPRAFDSLPVNHAAVTPDQFSLVEREIKRFRKNLRRAA